MICVSDGWPGASLAVTTSLEEILRQLTHKDELAPAVVSSLWDLVSLPTHSTVGVPSLMQDKQLAIARGAMAVLAMIARANSDTVFTVTSLVRVNDVLAKSFDLRLARHACAALQSFAVAWASERDSGSDSVRSARTKVVEDLLGLAVQLVRGCVPPLSACGADGPCACVVRPRRAPRRWVVLCNRGRVTCDV